jgi:DNA-binding NarL/FixJ family response regulator
MPEQSGQEFFETLQAGGSDLAERMVFVSGDTVSPETQAFLARSGRPYLLKPFKVNEMIEMVERLAAGN